MNQLKDWILGLPFVADWIKEERVNAFRLAQKDVLETMDDDLERRAQELANQKLATLLSIVDEKAVISAKGRSLLLGGEEVDPLRLANLKAEAEFFMASDLWKVMNETPKRLAEQAMFVDDGKLENNLLKGRAILFVLATQKKIIDTLKSVAISTPVPSTSSSL